MKIVQYLQIGRCLKVHRIQAGISQRKMADRLGIPVATYSNYENEYERYTGTGKCQKRAGNGYIIQEVRIWI